MYGGYQRDIKLWEKILPTKLWGKPPQYELRRRRRLFRSERRGGDTTITKLDVLVVSRVPNTETTTDPICQTRHHTINKHISLSSVVSKQFLASFQNFFISSTFFLLFFFLSFLKDKFWFRLICFTWLGNGMVCRCYIVKTDLWYSPRHVLLPWGLTPL